MKAVYKYDHSHDETYAFSIFHRIQMFNCALPHHYLHSSLPYVFKGILQFESYRFSRKLFEVHFLFFLNNLSQIEKNEKIISFAMSKYPTFTRFINDENVPTKTTTDAHESEASIQRTLNSALKLYRESHFKYCIRMLTKKGNIETFAGFKDESFFVWNTAYFLFPMRVLGYERENEAKMNEYVEKCTEYISNMITKDGVFSGLYMDNGHLVANYSCVMTIALIGTEKAYKLVDRQKIYKWLLELKVKNGSFRTTKGMEYDIRATFTALLIAYSFNILTPELTSGVEEFVLSCRSYDGGFSPKPGLESHGGYVHCAVGIMNILGKLDSLNLDSLIRWISMKQMEFSGGFQGRVNKLVDSCYSWWIGSSCKIISEHLGIEPFWNTHAMTDYLIKSAQYEDGGFCDHRPSGPDPFHTFFGLAGLCVSGSRTFGEGEDHIELPEVDSMLCVPKYLVERMHKYFYSMPFIPE